MSESDFDICKPIKSEPKKNSLNIQLETEQLVDAEEGEFIQYREKQ